MTIDDIIVLVTWVQVTDQKQYQEQIPLGSIATTLISNFVRYVRVTKELHGFFFYKKTIFFAWASMFLT